MIDCIFVSLKSAVNGSSVFFEVRSENVSISSSSFLNCSTSGAGGACFLSCKNCNFSFNCVDGCSAVTLGNGIYFSGSGVRLIERIGFSRSSPTEAKGCLGGFHYDSDSTTNLSSVNFTFCYSEYYPCVSAVNANNEGVHTVAFTGRYLNVFRNSGARGFYRANDMGVNGWYLWNSNFYNNSITDGVLGSSSVGQGMMIDSCIFFGNTVDIGFLGSSLNNAYKFRLTNCVFSGPFPSSSFASSSGCKSSSVAASQAISVRLCPTYSASASRTPFATQSTDFLASLPVVGSAPVRPSILPIAGSIHDAVSDTPTHSDTMVPGSALFMMSTELPEAASFVGLCLFTVTWLFEDSIAFVMSVESTNSAPVGELSMLATTWSCGDPVILVQSSILDAPLSSSLDSSGTSAGLIVSVLICVVAVLTAGSIGAVFFVRKVKTRTGSDESSQPDRSALRIDFADDTVDDTTVTTYVTTVTDEHGSGIPMSLPSEFASNVTVSLIY
jgi:hypothetical protein